MKSTFCLSAAALAGPGSFTADDKPSATAIRNGMGGLPVRPHRLKSSGTPETKAKMPIDRSRSIIAALFLATTLSSPAQAPVLLREGNTSLNVPSDPPATAFQLVPAFSSVPILKPTCLASPPGDSRRLFICEKNTGKIKVIPDVTATSPVSFDFLSLGNLATSVTQGILGLAFHPDYGPNPSNQNPSCYVFYSWNDGTAAYSRLSRFTVLNPGGVPVADPASELVLLQQLDRAGFHPGGDLHFGPDGFLYVSLGDEGFYDDSFNNAQHIDGNFYSAILRIDVDRKPGSLEPNDHPAVIREAGRARYAVPPDNPFIGATSFNGLPVLPNQVRTEFWAVGFRHPWRFSFDAVTGELWAGDVGEGALEEVNLVVRGGNYGWSFREGTHDGPKAASTPAGFNSIDPIHEIIHLNQPGDPNFKGNSITGGFVYRGTRHSALAGRYVFGDYVTGNIWAAERTGINSLSLQRIAGQTGIAAFGSDPSNGDILIADNDNDRILRLVAIPVSGSYPETLSTTGLFTDLASLAPAPGLLPYEPNLSFWSDHAVKRRWFSIPDITKTITWARDGLWTFPNGALWVKHFDMEMTRGNPATKRRLETRVLVKNATGAYGVSYRWNDTQTDAFLVPDGGADFTLNVTENGSVRLQSWHIPSRGECLACHTPAAGHALSFTTRQLNRPGTIHGVSGNQLDLLHMAGYFSNPPGSPDTLPRHLRPDETAFSLEARVRSYLAVNCSHCHRGGVAGLTAHWDGRPERTLDQTGLINGTPLHNPGDTANRLIVPGDTDRSVLWHRLGATNGFSRMPPLGTTEVDQTNLALMANWITQALPGRKSYLQWQQLWLGNANPADGQATADPDGDGSSNGEEFLAGTNPRDGRDFVQPTFTMGGGTAAFDFSLPANRSAWIDMSTDLLQWNPWDVPGNGGLPSAGGPFSISGPVAHPRQFFRLRLSEN